MITVIGRRDDYLPENLKEYRGNHWIREQLICTKSKIKHNHNSLKGGFKGLGDGSMAKCLLHKPENQDSNLQHPLAIAGHGQKGL